MFVILKKAKNKAATKMEGMIQDPSQQQQTQQQNQVVVGAERLNQALQQQLNLESLKTRAISLFKAITRILEDFDAYSRTNTTPKWSSLFLFHSFLTLNLQVFIYILGFFFLFVRKSGRIFWGNIQW